MTQHEHKLTVFKTYCMSKHSNQALHLWNLVQRRWLYKHFENCANQYQCWHNHSCQSISIKYRSDINQSLIITHLGCFILSLTNGINAGIIWEILSAYTLWLVPFTSNVTIFKSLASDKESYDSVQCIMKTGGLVVVWNQTHQCIQVITHENKTCWTRPVYCYTWVSINTRSLCHLLSRVFLMSRLSCFFSTASRESWAEHVTGQLHSKSEWVGGV